MFLPCLYFCYSIASIHVGTNDNALTLYLDDDEDDDDNDDEEDDGGLPPFFPTGVSRFSQNSDKL